MKRRTGAFRALWLVLHRHAGGDVLGFGALLAAVPRMVGRSLRGAYPLLNRKRTIMAGLGLLYVLSPIDLIPEGVLMLLFGPLGLVGYADDSVVLAWSVGTLLAEAELFTQWERGLTAGDSSTVIDGEVVDH